MVVTWLKRVFLWSALGICAGRGSAATAYEAWTTHRRKIRLAACRPDVFWRMVIMRLPLAVCWQSIALARIVWSVPLRHCAHGIETTHHHSGFNLHHHLASTAGISLGIQAMLHALSDAETNTIAISSSSFQAYSSHHKAFSNDPKNLESYWLASLPCS